MKIKKNSKKFTSGASLAGWEYFDDCLICQAMEKAEKRGRDLSGTELKDAFRLANEHQQKKGN